MDKYTKIVSFDVGAERPTTEYCEKLEAENARLQEYARHKSNCPVSLAWGSGPGGTGIKCECGFDKDYKYQPRGFGGWTSKSIIE